MYAPELLDELEELFKSAHEYFVASFVPKRALSKVYDGLQMI